ncbi:radial spoke protein 3-domain-containing protein [Chytridium lagenaria]|nr:radial spoke protein 3-domain-containing protein [Chytridium lagenaria]
MLSTHPPLPKSQTMVEESKPYDPTTTRQSGAEAYSFAAEPRAVAASRKKYREPSEKEGSRAPEAGEGRGEEEGLGGKGYGGESGGDSGVDSGVENDRVCNIAWNFWSVNVLFGMIAWGNAGMAISSLLEGWEIERAKVHGAVEVIHRGNTYASPVIPLKSNAKTNSNVVSAPNVEPKPNVASEPQTPLTVVNTLTSKPISTSKNSLIKSLKPLLGPQTDAFLDRAPSPLYVPQKSGLDVETQVADGELFDFDYEVAPLLEVIVGKTIEQALMEVMEEEEMEMLRKHQRDHEERRNAELAEVQRLEDAERRRTEEKERRLAEQIRILKEKQEAAEKVSARAFAQAYLANLVPSVLDNLSTNGYFYDAVEKEVETLFLPWLSGEVDKNMERLKMARRWWMMLSANPSVHSATTASHLLNKKNQNAPDLATKSRSSHPLSRAFSSPSPHQCLIKTTKKRYKHHVIGQIREKVVGKKLTFTPTLPSIYRLSRHHEGIVGVWDGKGGGEENDPNNPNLGHLGLSVALVTFSTLGIFCVIIFISVRNVFKDIYSPRRTLKVPVNYFANPLPLQQKDLDEAAYLRALTVENVPNSSPHLRVHLLFTWVFSFIGFGALVIYYRGYVDLKLHYTEYVLRRTRLSKIEMRSLIVFGIPANSATKSTSPRFSKTSVSLRNAVRNRALCLQQLERVYFDVRKGKRLFRAHPSWLWFFGTPSSPALLNGVANGEYGDVEGAPLLQNRRFSTSDTADPSLLEMMAYLDAVDPRLRPTHRVGFLGLGGEVVDSARYYAERFKEWDSMVHELRRSPERSPPTAVGFVTFESPESAFVSKKLRDYSSQIILSRRPFACMARMAPEPRDIYWPNLSSRAADSSVKVLRGLVVNSVLVFVVFLSTIAIFTLASLNVLPSMDLEKFPFLKDLFDRLGKNGKEMLQQVVLTLLFNAWTSSVASAVDGCVFLVLSQLQGMEALSWIEMSVFSKYFFYIIYNILLYVVGRTLWDILDKTDLNFNTVIQILGDTMPKLVLAGPVLLTWLLRLAPWSRTSPRDVSDAYYPSLLTSLNYGVSYTIPHRDLDSAIAPLILPFCAAFFAIAYFVHKYLLLYVHLPKYESAGLHAPMAIRRCLSGLMIMQISMMGVLAFKHGSKDSTPSSLISTLANGVRSAAPEWSGYVQMIVGVFPLLEGYEKLIRNAPIELVGKVARELSKTPRTGKVHANSADAAMAAPSESPRRAADFESLDKFKELGDVSPRRWMGGRGRLTRRRLQDENVDSDSLLRSRTLLGTELLSPLIPSQNMNTSRESQDIDLTPSSPEWTVKSSTYVNPEASPTSPSTMFDSAVKSASLSATPTRDSFTSFRREDDATYSLFEEPSEVDGDDTSGVEDLSDGEDLISPSAPLEPPSIVFLESSMPHSNPPSSLKAMKTKTCSKLLLTSQQPRRLREAREDQIRQQRALFRRIVGLQKVGVAAIGTGMDEEDADEVEDFRGGPRGLLGKECFKFENPCNLYNINILELGIGIHRVSGLLNFNARRIRAGIATMSHPKGPASKECLFTGEGSLRATLKLRSSVYGERPMFQSCGKETWTGKVVLESRVFATASPEKTEVVSADSTKRFKTSQVSHNKLKHMMLVLRISPDESMTEENAPIEKGEFKSLGGLRWVASRDFHVMGEARWCCELILEVFKYFDPEERGSDDNDIISVHDPNRSSQNPASSEYQTRP